MTRTRRLDQAYDLLEPAERVRLAIEADARDDDRESARLARSCPQYTYSMCDRDVFDPLNLAYEFSHVFAIELLGLDGRVEAAEVAHDCAELRFGVAVDGAEFAAKAANPSNQVASRFAKTMRRLHDSYLADIERLKNSLVADASIAAHGFAAFCRDELLVEPETLLRAGSRAIVPTFERYIRCPADAESVAASQVHLTGVWRRRLGLQLDPPPIET